MLYKSMQVTLDTSSIHRSPKMFLWLLFICLLGASCKQKNSTSEGQAMVEPKWESIFNGESLSGWTPKIVGHPAGENWKNTFQVEDGVLKVNYAEYDKFDGEYGHIFYKTPYSKYRLRLEYRFVGDQAPGGEGWAYRNNGIMFHSQSAASMNLDQAFPVSLEFQFLGGDGTNNPRSSGCLCTPGTNVIVADTLTTRHCMPNGGPTIQGDIWVKAEVYADGSKVMHHLINGDTVMTYRNPTIGGGYLPENYPMSLGAPVEKGYIALQSETAPTEFRNIEIQVLE